MTKCQLLFRIASRLHLGHVAMLKKRGRPKKERPSGIGRFLTQAREKQGATQQQIATKLNKSKSLICKIERGYRSDKSLHGILLYDLAKAYSINISDLLEKANWPRLPLLNTSEEERMLLIKYLMKIRSKKK